MPHRRQSYRRWIDPDAEKFLSDGSVLPSRLRVEQLPEVRSTSAANAPHFSELAANRSVSVREIDALACGGQISVLSPVGRVPNGCVVFFHGGGLMFGNRFFEGEALLDMVERHNVVVVAPEYRLAPEHPYPAALDDSMAALNWVMQSVAALDVDRSKIIIGGRSAGGHLAAACALRARDEAWPTFAGQLLIYPMLDDRTIRADEDGSALPVWDVANNELAWHAYLGRAGEPTYGVPMRADSFAGLPSAYIEVGSADLFRDECTAYATSIWSAGGRVEVHVWDGGYHGFDHLARDTPIARAAIAARGSWIDRILGATDH